MKLLMGSARTYIERMDIWDVSMLKICLCALGVLIGINVCEDKKKHVGIVAIFVFIATYIPLMAKFLGIFVEKKEDEKYSIDEDCFEIMD